MQLCVLLRVGYSAEVQPPLATQPTGIATAFSVPTCFPVSGPAATVAVSTANILGVEYHTWCPMLGAGWWLG